MDYNSLLSLRTAFANLLKSKDLHPPHSEQTASNIRTARQAASHLTTNHVIRELHLLPIQPNRIHLLRLLGDGIGSTPAAIRRAAFLSRDLLKIPDSLSDRNRPSFNHAIASMIVTWQHALRERNDHSVALELDALSESFPHALQLVRNRNQLQNVHDNPSPTPSAQPQQVLTSLPHLADQFDERREQIANLDTEIDNAVLILDELGIQELQAGGHDGIHELVTSVWAQLRSQFNALKSLAAETQRMSDVSIDAVTKLRAADLLADINVILSRLHCRHTKLSDIGFNIPDLSSMHTFRNSASAAIADDNESDSSDDDEEWEDAVEIEHDDSKETEAKQPEGSEQTSGTGPALPPVNDWVSVMKGKDNGKANREILDRFERQATNQVAGREDGPSSALTEALEGIRGRNRGRGSKRGRGRTNGKRTSARKRLSAALGMRKKRSKLE